jgi:hypothetical protein
MNDLATTILTIVAICIAAFLLCVVLPMGAVAKAQCLEAGWPRAQITWNLHRYCIKRVDQTDVVRPLSEVAEDVR